MNPLVLAAAPAVISGIAGFFGGERANKANRKEAAINRQFQAGEAALNRGFQERMRNTEWQAAVEDMRLAGINPAVAYSRGGASSPGGSMAGGSLAAPAVDSIGSGVSTAMAVRAQQKSLELMQEQIHKTRAEASAAQSDAGMKFVDQRMAQERYNYYFDETGRPRGPLKELLDSQFAGSIAGSARSVSEAELAALSVPERKAIAELFEMSGPGGKGLQLLLPLLQTLLRR